MRTRRLRLALGLLLTTPLFGLTHACGSDDSPAQVVCDASDEPSAVPDTSETTPPNPPPSDGSCDAGSAHRLGVFVAPFDKTTKSDFNWDHLAAALLAAGVKVFVIQAVAQDLCDVEQDVAETNQIAITKNVDAFLQSLVRYATPDVKVFVGMLLAGTTSDRKKGPNGEGDPGFWGADAMSACTNLHNFIERQKAILPLVGAAATRMVEAGLYGGCYVTNEFPVLEGEAASTGIADYLGASIEHCRSLDAGGKILLSPTVLEKTDAVDPNTPDAARAFGRVLHRFLDAGIIVAAQDGVGAHPEADGDIVKRYEHMARLQNEIIDAGMEPWLNVEAFQDLGCGVYSTAPVARIERQLDAAFQQLQPIPSTILFFEAQHIEDVGKVSGCLDGSVEAGPDLNPLLHSLSH